MARTTRPVVQFSSKSRIVTVGQAPGTKVHKTVRSFKEYGTQTIPLPHPSWRSRIWMKKNPWFEAKLLPVLRRRVKKRPAD